LQTWLKKWWKWVAGGAAGVVVVLVLVLWLVFAPSRPEVGQQDQIRESLTTGGLSHELRDKSGGMTGFVWVPPKGNDPVVVFQEVKMTVSGGKCQSVTAELFASSEGKGPSAKKQQLGTYSYSGGAVDVKAASGPPQPLLARAKKEFEQMTAALK